MNYLAVLRGMCDVSRPKHTTHNTDGGLQNSESYKMAVQIPYRVYTEYRRRTLFGVVRRELGPFFRRLAEQKGCIIEEGHILLDHVHMLVSIPPKLAVSSVVEYLKGKSAIHVARARRDSAA